MKLGWVGEGAKVPGFDQAWAAVANLRDGESVSPRLRPLLQTAYAEVLSDPLDLVRLRTSLEALLEFLAGEGRTNANCWAVDRFFGNCQGWERDWGECNLPENLHDVLAMMGEALHDTVKAPDIAQNFGCLPEQLLSLVRQSPGTTSSGTPVGL